MSTINPDKIKTYAADWTCFTNPRKIRDSDFYRIDIFLDLLRFDADILNDYLTGAMENYRGLQFACGSILLQNQDIEVTRTLTDAQKKACHIRETSIQEFDIPRNDDVQPGRGVLIVLDPMTTEEERHKVMDFMIKLIFAKEKSKNRQASRMTPNLKTK